MIYVQIVDDGKGFDLATAQNKGSFGLLGMHERARSLNGTLKIDSSIKMEQLLLFHFLTRFKN